MCMALATQRMPSYEPPRCVVLSTIRLAALAASSPCLIAWRKPAARDAASQRWIVSGRGKGVCTVAPAACDALRVAAELLRVVRSFEGDMAMFETVAKMAKSGRLQLTHAAGDEQQPKVPLCHLVDQHTYRGVAHIGPAPDTAKGGDSFEARFQTIFDTTTGFNPRIASPLGFEKRPIVRRVRFAQRCVAEFALKRRTPPAVGAGTSMSSPLQLSLDSGVLAAAVGPIAVKVSPPGKSKKQAKEVLVLLGVRDPADEVVMLKPARATRDLFGTLSDEERAAAIASARTRTLKAHSPLLPAAGLSGDGGCVVTFADGCWRLDGEEWLKVAERGLALQVPLLKPPAWAAKPVATQQQRSESLASVLVAGTGAADEALREALCGDEHLQPGLVEKAEECIKALCAAAPTAIALRAVGMLRQQYVNVSMPTPALFGGISGDQLLAYNGDWDAYRLLVLVSRLAPGALRPSMPPSFAIPQAALLRQVEVWMMVGARGLQETQGNPTNGWKQNKKWSSAMAIAKGRLMEHQRAALDTMNDRDRFADTGHFLIMDTGLGKTLTSLCYLYSWLVKQGARAPKRILWVTPAGTVENLVTQLQTTWQAPVWLVPRVTVSKKPKPGEATKLQLKDFQINVIHADHLRAAIDLPLGLAKEAPTSVIVFDEVDEMYAPTLRTSAARRLAQLCAKFVAQTATPMRRNEAQLRA